MKRMVVITLMGIAIVGGSGLPAAAGETTAKVEKGTKALKEEMKGNKTKAELERTKGNMKGAGERVKGKSKEMKARAE